MEPERGGEETLKLVCREGITANVTHWVWFHLPGANGFCSTGLLGFQVTLGSRHPPLYPPFLAKAINSISDFKTSKPIVQCPVPSPLYNTSTYLGQNDGYSSKIWDFG